MEGGGAGGRGVGLGVKDRTGSLCTFLPKLAEAPVQQSQDKADDYGQGRLQ